MDGTLAHCVCTANISSLWSGQGLEAFDKPTKKSVKTAVHMLAEETLRLACHAKLVHAFESTGQMLHIEGCALEPEPGRQEEDEYGFLQSAGGFESYRAGMVDLVPFFDQAAFVDKVLHISHLQKDRLGDVRE